MRTLTFGDRTISYDAGLDTMDHVISGNTSQDAVKTSSGENMSRVIILSCIIRFCWVVVIIKWQIEETVFSTRNECQLLLNLKDLVFHILSKHYKITRLSPL